MAVFQVVSRVVKVPDASRKPISLARRRWYAAQRIICGLLIIWLLVALSRILDLSFWFFILLPVSMSIIIVRPRLYNRNALLLTTCLALLYFGGITVLQLSVHRATTPEIIVVTTTLFMAVLFEPVRSRVQTTMEQLLHLRDEEVSRAVEIFTSTLREEIDLDQVRQRFLDVIQKTMQPQIVSIWIYMHQQDDTVSPRVPLRRGENNRPIQHEGSIQGTQEYSEISVDSHDLFVAYVLHHDDIVEIDSLHLDSRLLSLLKASKVEVVLPLISQGELLGLLNLGPRLNELEYASEDRRLLNTLAAQVAPALRVVQMVQAQQLQVREHTRIEQELRTARHIQQSLLPEEVPQVAGWQFVPYYRPAREVGGDFYDFLTFEDGQLGLVIGDVTGKGVPAALVMATTCTMLRTATQATSSPGEVLTRVNDLLASRIPPSMFVTCFYLKLDPRSGHLRYANAGHDWPFRQCNGNISELQVTGMPLGMMPGTRYEEQEAILSPGECILLYSDGVVEAHNQRQEMFGLPHLKAVIEKHVGSAAFIDSLLDQLTLFTGDDWEQEDDITLVLLQREPLPMSEVGGEVGANGWQMLGAWMIPSVMGNERLAMALVTETLSPLVLPAERLARLESAVAETVMNAMEHGNHYSLDHPVLLQVCASPTAIMVRVQDDGGYQPMRAMERSALPDLTAKLAEQQRPRGWGLFLIHNLVDKLQFSGDDDHNVVELIMYQGIPAATRRI